MVTSPLCGRTVAEVVVGGGGGGEGRDDTPHASVGAGVVGAHHTAWESRSASEPADEYLQRNEEANRAPIEKSDALARSDLNKSISARGDYCERAKLHIASPGRAGR